MPVVADLPEPAWALALGSLQRMGSARLRAVLAGRAPSEAYRAIQAGEVIVGHPFASGEAKATVLFDRWRCDLAGIDVDALWQRTLDAHIRVAVRGDEHYPDDLVDDVDPPPLLMWMGDHVALGHRRVAIVGTRNPTITGTEIAFELGETLATNGISVVSGLADGIDVAAHRGALKAGRDGAPPIGVVGSGLDVIYPRRSASVWREVAQRGLLYSEAPPGCSPEAWRFPLRNRIIAALAEIVVVVESRSQGGSMITVNEAIARNVTVMAVPGSVRNEAAKGTNDLLFDGVSPVREPRDVLEALGLVTRAERVAEKKQRTPSNPDDAKVLRLFGSDALTLDDIANVAGRSLGELAVSLNRLETEGFVDRRGGWYVPRSKPRAQR
ncbi:MAG: DNA-processing protein DprA [Acidimicrobiia bacterium]